MDDNADNGQSPLWHEFDQFLAYIAVNPGHRPLALEPGVGGASSTDAMDVLEVRSVDWQTTQNADEMQADLPGSEDTLTESLPMDCENEGAFGSWNNFSDALLETTLSSPPIQGAKAGYADNLQESITGTAEPETSIVEKPTTKEKVTNGETVSALNTDAPRKRKRAAGKGSIKLLMKLASSIADMQPEDHTTDENRDSQKKSKLGVVEEVQQDFNKPHGSDSLLKSPDDSLLQSENTVVAFTVSDFDAICQFAITHAALEKRAARRLPRVKINPQPMLVRKSGSKPDVAYHIVEPLGAKPKTWKTPMEAQGPPAVPTIQKRKQIDQDSAEVVQRKKLKPDKPLPLQSTSKRKNRVTSAVPAVPSTEGHRMRTRAITVDVTPSTSGTTGSPPAELPKPAVDGRRHPNVPSKYRCGTCHKTYLGNRMQHHQTANPTHRTVAQLEGEPSKSSRDGDVQSSVATESAPTRSDNEQPAGRLNQLIQIVSAEPEPNRSRLMQEFWQQMHDLTPNLTGVALVGGDPKLLAGDSDHSNIDHNEQAKTLQQNVQHLMQVQQDNSDPGGPVMGGGLVRPNVPQTMEVNTMLLGRMDTPAALPNCILDELLVASGMQLLDDLSVLELDQHDLF
ncbi:uncharacterized protein LOC118466444 [Anopheles albimanus]|uniref:uncharacterized protein LOC118466444 n=1 Tax=Anopheles albimanus TaxID=7167 RepID=UPI001640BC65|nr:uncharacterized protein LOC118466444 [Anopheles albimanus]XP_035791667.1 uncharacterized protein LOC118466444 [Anopheles albimanus]XP_035791678.1 uncharacterized protein LOC118466444 [Anopheles albimanus]XP_035791686.1 uncharacterized protein LOC118466444 [Anopheles albimanus]